MKLIDDWRESWKYHSVKIGTIASALAFGLAASGGVTSWVGLIPNWLVFLLGGCICLLIVFSRLVKQGDDK